METNNNINLYEILKGHGGEIFYSPCCGYIELTNVGNYVLYFDDTFKTNSQGKINDRGECVIFPSKDQRDWNKWVEEQKPKVPKTWSEYINIHRYEFNKGVGDYCIDVTGHNNNGWTRRNTPIEKSALALLKIHQLIEVGYGGNVSKEKWEKIDYNKWIIKPLEPLEGFDIRFVDRITDYSHVAFSTVEQAKEFLKYPENVQLLKYYFMI